MTQLLDLPGLAREVLRKYAADRVEAGLPVVWYSDGSRFHAQPDDGKYTGAWHMRSGRWEQHFPKEWVLEELAAADAVEVIE